MKTAIYFFTGTGNSLKIAKDLQNNLEDCKIINIFDKKKNIDLNQVKSVGLIFPIHMFGIPSAVIKFVKNLDISQKHYFFSIAHYGGRKPIFTFKDLQKILKKKKVKVGFIEYIMMPVNYTPFFGAISDRMQKRLFKREEESIEKLSDTIINNKVLDFKKTPFTGFNLLFPLFALVRKSAKKMDKKFYITEKCDGCGICEKVCPTNNIKMDNSKPIWQHNCTQCFACLGWCPQAAIEFGKSTRDRKRYHNPTVSVKELMLRD